MGSIGGRVVEIFQKPDFGRVVVSDHISLVKRVLSRLKEHKLAIAPEKCEWHKSRVNFLGYIISADSVEMDQEKKKNQDCAGMGCSRDC